ncbi:MAG: tetratricopeptide repeat protein [Euryarchaeota archaeon]|nr:tetratricopeptide repeat protein [Euryarchaeota archaeon]
MVEAFYEHVFRGDPHYFEDGLEKATNKFFVGNETEFYFMHAVQVKAVERVYPLDPLERYIGRLEEVLRSLEVDKSLILLWSFAIWLCEIKKCGESLKFWDAFIENEPDLAEAYYYRGVTHAELNQPEKEIEDYKKAIESKLGLAGNYTAVGIKYSEIGKYGESARYLRKGGFSFLKLWHEGDAAKSFDLCFNLRNYSGMSIGLPIVILYFLARKITAEGAEERRALNRLFPLCAYLRTLRLNSLLVAVCSMFR